MAETGKRTSVYLRGDDLARIASAGNPPVVDLIREALDLRESAVVNANARRRSRNQPAPEARGVAAMVGGRPDPATCPHPPRRRDSKNPALCRACGTVVQPQAAQPKAPSGTPPRARTSKAGLAPVVAVPLGHGEGTLA